VPPAPTEIVRNERVPDGLTLHSEPMEILLRILAISVLACTIAFPAMAENAPAQPGTAEINSVPVYDEQNEKLGEAREVVVDPKGDVRGMIVKVSDDVATPTEVVVPLDRVKVATGEKKVVIAATKDEVKAMPKPQDAPGARAGGT
jgi:sporulation protein YlmC with PRC-barrel domain